MKINVKNTEALEVALNDVQSRSQVRLLDVQTIESICKQAVESLKKMGMYRADMAGAKLRFNNGYGTFAASYNGVPQATNFDFEVIKTGIVITDIYRSDCNSSERIDFTNQSSFLGLFGKRDINLIAS